MTTCPHCDGPWQPYGTRGVLHFQHAPTPYCEADTDEISRQLADATRRTPRTRWRAPEFTRPATARELELLAHIGYTPAPDLEVHVTWIGSLRRRTFPALAPVEGLPDPTN